MTNKKNKYHKKNDHSQSTSRVVVNEEELTAQCLELHELLKNRTNKLRAMKNNELCYLLSTNWLKEWKEFVGYEQLVGDQQQKSNKKDKRFGKKHPGKINTDITAHLTQVREYYTIPKELEDYQYLNELTNEKKEKDDDFIAITPDIWQLFLNYYEGEPIRRPVKTIKGSLFYDGEPLRCDVVFADLDEEGLEERIKKASKKSYNSIFPSQKLVLSTLWTIKELKQFLSQYCSVVYNTSKIRVWKGFSYVATNPIVESLVESIKDRKFLIKARQLTDQRYKQHEIDYYIKSTHTLIVQMGDILKTDEHEEQQIKGYCEECVQKKSLTIGCVCNEVIYCTRKCRTTDQTFHFYTCKKAFDSEDDEEYSQLSIDEAPKAGLDNIGNTCYMNSTIQAIISIEHIRQFFSKNEFLHHQNEKQLKDNNCMLLSKFSKTIKALIQEKDSYTPWPLKSQIDYNLAPFKGDKQHDANDFLVNFLNTLNDYLKKSEDKAYHSILEPFVGEFFSKVLCPHCNAKSQNVQIFLQISLPIKAKVFQKIYQYTVVESLSKIRRGKSCVLESWKQMKNSVDAGTSIICKTKEPEGLVMIKQQEQQAQKVFKNLKGDIIFFRDMTIQEGQIPFVFGLVTTKLIVGNNLKSPYGTLHIMLVEHELKTLGTFWLQIIKCYFQDNSEIVSEAERIQKDYFTEIQSEIKTKPEEKEGKEEESTQEKQKRQNKIDERYTQILQMFTQKIGIQVYINHYKRNRNLCKFCNKKCSSCDLPKTFAHSFKEFFEDRYNQVRFQVYLREPLEVQYTNIDKSIIGDPNLQDCLDLFTQPQLLDEQNAWYCSQCDSMALAQKQLHVKTFPSILILHLNRFKTFEHKKMKNSDPIQYQEVQDFGGKQYRLISVIIHEGSMDAGHYWSICLRDGEYYVFNDAKVSKVEKVFHKNAYILIYSLLQ